MTVEELRAALVDDAMSHPAWSHNASFRDFVLGPEWRRDRVTAMVEEEPPGRDVVRRWERFIVGGALAALGVCWVTWWLSGAGTVNVWLVIATCAVVAVVAADVTVDMRG